MAEIVRYNFIQHVCFEVSGRDLSPKIVDPIIGNLHDKLDNFYYESHPFKIRPMTIDGFMAKERGSKVIGSWQIKWDIIDLEKEDAMERKNNKVKPLITQLVKRMGVEIGMKQFRVVIRIVNSRFEGEFKDGIWPDLNDIQSTGL